MQLRGVQFTGACMAQSVKPLILGFCSGDGLRVLD